MHKIFAIIYVLIIGMVAGIMTTTIIMGSVAVTIAERPLNPAEFPTVRKEDHVPGSMVAC